MKIEVETLRIRKTPIKQRNIYTYVAADGRKIVLYPDRNGVTEVHIKMLHSMDDAEVYNNLKNARPEPTKAEKQRMREWEEQHPGEKAHRNWNLSLDASLTDEDDSTTLGDMIAAPEKTDSPEVERLRQIVATMTERQQQVLSIRSRRLSTISRMLSRQLGRQSALSFRQHWTASRMSYRHSGRHSKTSSIRDSSTSSRSSRPHGTLYLMWCALSSMQSDPWCSPSGMRCRILSGIR